MEQLFHLKEDLINKVHMRSFLDFYLLLKDLNQSYYLNNKMSFIIRRLDKLFRFDQ